jgi:hypothetical protein|tara:strand:- start:1933 stop:2604 length:672 start_codon:yes stop_codon:yes gene_type:complete
MKVKILVPESLAEITLEQYQKFLKISEENENSLFLQQKMIEIFCNIELKQVLNIKYNSIVKITNHLNKLFEQKPEFTPTFKRQNLEFGFIPKLDDMTFGEFVDLDTTIADWENIHKAMGVLYRPVTLSKNKKYQIESYESFDKYDMQKMPLDVVLGALFFFWNLSKELTIHIPNFFREELQNLTSQQKQTLEESGVGIQAYMDSVMEMYLNLTKLQDSHYTNA